MNRLLQKMLRRALPMNAIDGDGGSGGGAMTTDSFADMLGAPDDNGQTDPSDPQNAPDDQQNGSNTDPQDDPNADPDADPNGDPGPADDPNADPDGQPDTDPNAAVIELEIDGEKVALTKDEVKSGYLRQQDYTQKTQALARERQDWGQHVARQAAEVQQFSQELGQLHQIDAALKQYQAVDWQALRDQDPGSYGVHLAEFNDLRARRGEVATGIQHKQQQLAAATQQDFAQKSQEAQAHLASLIPGFGKEHVAELRAYGQKVGFSADELAQVADKRSLEVLWKAAQFDKQQNTTQQAIKKVAALPTKAAKAAPAAKPAAQLNLEKQTRRLEQTGSVQDFAALLGMTTPRKG
jgi:hypothetical protein